MMFALQYTEELLMTLMKNTVLLSRPAGLFHSQCSPSSPLADYLINDAADALARLGKVEVKLRGKMRSVNIVSAKEKRKKVPGKLWGP